MKQYLFTALCVFAGLTATANHVSPEQALQRLDLGQSRRMAAFGTSQTPTLAAELSGVYVFTTPSGYMILPNDDIALPLLAYGSDLDLQNPLLNYWLDFYASEIAAAKEAGVTSAAPAMRVSRPAVAPLLSTKWNQSEPFNNLCPTVDGERCVTGCVATAMAQVLKYHQWPEKGVGTYSYTWKTGNQELSFDYENTTFDWANMLDVYDANATEQQQNAVATLMSACGIAVDMDYDVDESGAQRPKIGRALLRNFNFDKGLYLANRNFYTAADWENLIYNEVANNRPVLYGGGSDGGAHQFVVDGYSSDGFFHINWGWGGTSDGYFTLNALNPSNLGIGGGAGGYNFNQGAYIGVQKPQEGSEAPTPAWSVTEALSLNVETATVGSKIEISGRFNNEGLNAIPAGSYIGMKFTPTDGGNIKYAAYGSFSEVSPTYGVPKMEITIPALNEGDYLMTPVYRLSNNDDWLDMPCNLTVNHSFIASVLMEDVTFSIPKAATVTASDLSLTTPLYWSIKYGVKYTLTNNNESEFYGAVLPVLLNADGEIVAKGGRNPVLVAANSSANYDYYDTFTADNTPEAGAYRLGLQNYATGELLGDIIEVELKDAPENTTISVTDFHLEGEITDPKNVKFTMTVSCTEGYFANYLRVGIFDAENNPTVFNGEIIYLPAGETIEYTITADMSDMANGNYRAWPYMRNNSSAIADGVNFVLPVFQEVVPDVPEYDPTAIREVEADKEANQLYDLQGRKVLNPGRHGIYISPSGKIVK